MARTARDVEAYLTRLGKRFENPEEGTYVVASSADAPPVALRVADPMVVMRVVIGEAPQGKPEVEAKVFRRLLELNATEIVYCSYGLEENQIALSSALELRNLDINELEAVLEDMGLALVRHVPALRELCKG